MTVIPETVQEVVIDAYYQQALAAPEAARRRAQAAYAIAAAIAAGLVAAGVLGKTTEHPALAVGVGAAAVCAWLLATSLFAVAVSSPFEIASEPWDSAEAVVRAALSAAAREREAVDRWQRRARWVAALAVVLTLASVGIAVVGGRTRGEPSTLILTPAGAKAFRKLCDDNTPSDRLTAKVEDSADDDAVVALYLDPGTCGLRSGRIVMLRKDIAVIAAGTSEGPEG